MLGTLVNSAAIIAGVMVGMFLRKGIPEKIQDGLIKALGLCVVYIGLRGISEGQNTLVILFSMIIGTVLGELIDLDKCVNKLGIRIEQKLKNTTKGSGNFAEAFVNATLLYCTGAMAVVGALQSGMLGDHQTLFAKAVLDGVISIVFASSMGWGVIGAAVSVFVYQGIITLLAQWISPLLTDIVIAEMTCIGSIILISIGFNLIKITNIRAMNFVPAIFMPIIINLFI